MRYSRTLISLALLLVATTTVMAADPSATQPVSGPDLVVSVGDLPARLARVEKAAKEIQGEVSTPLLAALKQWLGGTEWIDSTRPIVLAVGRLKDKGPVAVLVPFRQTNDGFRTQHNAQVEADAYLVRLGEGKVGDLPADLRQSLVAASRTAPERLLTLDLSLSSWLQREGGSVGQAISGTPEAGAGPESDPNRPSAEELQRMLSGAVDLGQQAERLTLGLDLGEGDVATVVKVKAIAGSSLADLLVEGGPTVELEGYQPQGQVRFRSRNYNLAGVLQLLDQGFGELYRHAGIDFKQVAGLGDHMTGEMAGGVQFGKNDAKLEVMAVLKNGAAAGGFIEETYLPWLLRYGESMGSLVEKASGVKSAALITRSADSTVAGRKVVGVTARVPLALNTDAKTRKSPLPLVTYPLRMTVVNNLLLTAPSDARLAELIKTAGELKSTPARGPLMSWEADLSSYLSNLLALLPEFKERRVKVPPMGQAKSQLDFKGGEAIASTRMTIADVKAVFQLFSQLAPAATQSAPSKTIAPRRPAGPAPAVALGATGTAQPSAAPARALAGGSDTYYSRGALAAAYGNNAAAARYFKRVLKHDPNNSHAQFQLGVALAQLAEYPEALQAMDEALRLKPDTGLFYYGRGRTYLMSGENAKADADFRRAAELEDPQALQYRDAQRR
jgi:hypothetical protein